MRPYGVVSPHTDVKLANLFDDDPALLAKVRERMKRLDQAIDVGIDDL